MVSLRAAAALALCALELGVSTAQEGFAVDQPGEVVRTLLTTVPALGPLRVCLRLCAARTHARTYCVSVSRVLCWI